MKKGVSFVTTIVVLAMISSFSLIACNKNIDITLSFIVDDEAYHTIETKGNEEINLPDNPTKAGCIFDGWYLDNNVWNEPFTANSLLSIPLSENLSVYAKWTEDEWQLTYTNTFTTYQRIDANGTPTADGGYILFGEYPQTIKASDVIVGTTAVRGGFLGSDGFCYYKGFKVEPIKWRILSESDGIALILCESIIANKRFDGKSNNYKDSEIRAWLNYEFYNTAFTSLQKGLIQTTEVDNSPRSSGMENVYSCANTNDKIFLPSYSEIVNQGYGFNPFDLDPARRRLASDYSNTASASKANCWWLRSPHYEDFRGTRYIGSDGDSENKDCVLCIFGIVPALRISLS